MRSPHISVRLKSRVQKAGTKRHAKANRIKRFMPTVPARSTRSRWLIHETILAVADT
jgi:hypothetical protein